MLRVPIRQATPGMRLAVPIQHPLRGTTLLTAGFALDDGMIKKLIELQVDDVWIEYPDTEQIRQYVSPSVLCQQAQVIGTVAGMFDHVHRQAHARLDFANYRKSIQGLIESLVIEPVAASYIVEMGGAGGNELRHCSEVCFLSLLLGLKLQGYLVQQRRRLRPKDAGDVISLGLGAMLHDIGKTVLDEETRRRFEATGDTSDPQWRQHVVTGHRMLTGSIPPAAAGAILHHHQFFDGSGYPSGPGADGRPTGLRGEEIHVFARIVCVANEFDHMRHPRAGSPLPRVRVLKSMLAGPLTSRFDPIVLAALPLVVPAYPPGSVVKLSNGESAAVIEWHPEAPCQPTVQVLKPDQDRSARQPVNHARYDLRARTDILVVEHDGSNVEQDNFRLIQTPVSQRKDAA